MHVFLYEFITGGGWLASNETCPASLLAEGKAMVCALAEDLAGVSGVEVSVLRDGNLEADCWADRNVRRTRYEPVVVADLEAHQREFRRLAAAADWTIVIAPELDAHLIRQCRAVEAAGGRQLGPSLASIELTSDKQATAERLYACGVPVPEGRRFEPGGRWLNAFPFPAVIKPCDGAGSQDVFLIRTAAESAALASMSGPRRIERFQEGLAASVAFLCGPRGHVVLPPCRQHLSDDGRFRYRGGSLLLDDSLVARATRLATRAAEAVPALLGFVGVDLVLGDDDDGRGDVVIEINPRLTTSYVGLRAAAQQNLAAAMLAVAAGQKCTLAFAREPLSFGADGAIVRAAEASLR